MLSIISAHRSELTKRAEASNKKGSSKAPPATKGIRKYLSRYHPCRNFYYFLPFNISVLPEEGAPRLGPKTSPEIYALHWGDDTCNTT